MNSTPSAIDVRNTTISYGEFAAVNNVSVSFPMSRFTCIIGPNGCGKSTLLRAIARVLPLQSGEISVLGRGIDGFKRKELSRQVALMAQDGQAPENLTVSELVARGRFAYQGMFGQRDAEDWLAVEKALETVELTTLADRRVSELSGGQRQRAWLAMTLAQDTPVMLLDEPTTFLDIGYQHDLLNLVASLRREQDKTIVAVVHDLQQAVRFADHIVAMRGGEIVGTGAPQELVTPALIKDLFGLDVEVTRAGQTGQTVIIPR